MYLHMYVYIYVQMGFRATNSVKKRMTVGGSGVDTLHSQPILTFCTLVLYASENDTIFVYQIAFGCTEPPWNL